MMTRQIRDRYVVVYVPRELASRAQPFLKEYGYVHLGDLVRDLLRRWIDEKERIIWGK